MSKPTRPHIQVGTKYRFEVASAEEAVSRIREQMGTRARVISVKQKSGKGLGRFMSSPRLEIIAMIPDEDSLPESSPRDSYLPRSGPGIGKRQADFSFTEKAAEPQTQESSDRAETPFREGPSPEDPSIGASQSISENGREENTELPAEAYHSSRNRLSFHDDPAGMNSGPAPAEGIERVLHRAGLDAGILGQLQQSDRWEEMQDMPLHYALSEFGFFLKQKFNELPDPILGTRVAFLGLPGSGKTTALCKVLSEKVFRFNEKPAVAKMDSDLPNPDDALRVFCDVLGVEFTAHRPDDDDLRGGGDPGALLLDTAGLGLRDLDGWIETGRRLDALKIQSRILVLNAAYDIELLKQQVRLGDLAGATHFILTHLDETQAGLRIWPVLFGAGLAPSILSFGQDVAGDFTSHVFEYLLGETLPSLTRKKKER